MDWHKKQTGFYYILMLIWLTLASALIISCYGLPITPSTRPLTPSIAQSKSATAPTQPNTKQQFIPYGTYVYDNPISTSTIVLNSDGTYSTKFLQGFGVDVGNYSLTSDFITFSSEADKSVSRYQYRYSEQFHCLYVYIVTNSNDPPAQYFKR